MNQKPSQKTIFQAIVGTICMNIWRFCDHAIPIPRMKKESPVQKCHMYWTGLVQLSVYVSHIVDNNYDNNNKNNNSNNNSSNNDNNYDLIKFIFGPFLRLNFFLEKNDCSLSYQNMYWVRKNANFLKAYPHFLISNSHLGHRWG